MQLVRGESSRGVLGRIGALFVRIGAFFEKHPQSLGFFFFAGSGLLSQARPIRIGHPGSFPSLADVLFELEVSAAKTKIPKIIIQSRETNTMLYHKQVLTQN